MQDKSKWIQGNTPGTVSDECSPRGEVTQKHAGQVFCSAWLKESVFISGRWLVVFNLPARHQMSLLCRYCFTRGRWWSSNRMFAQLRCPVWAAACTGQHKGRLCFYFTWCRSPAPPLSFIFWWALMYAILSQGCFFSFAKLTFIRVTPAVSFPPFPILMWQSARLISECLLCEPADSRRDENVAEKQTAWGDDVFLSFTSVLFCACLLLLTPEWLLLLSGSSSPSLQKCFLWQQNGHV